MRGFVDIHVHLQHLFDPGAALDRAEQAGVRRFVCNATQEPEWSEVLRIAREHRSVLPCYGVHPWHSHETAPGWETRLEEVLTQSRSGVGETGLDRWKEGLSAEAQETAFRVQLSLARQLKRPVMVHCLRAWEWLLDVLKSEAPLSEPMLLHSFGGSREMLFALADRGAYFSFAGDVLDEKHKRKREALRAAPRDRLLWETDAPDMLPPEAYRLTAMEQNEPANLPAIAAGVAELLEEDPESLAEQVWENGSRFLSALSAEQEET